MALDLDLVDPLLTASQNSQSRHPLVEIISSNPVPDIPFDGQYLHPSETSNEKYPNAIMHSTGRLCKVYIYGVSQYYIKYVYTDISRTTFSDPVTVTIIGQTPVEATLCELANGNIGIVYLRNSTDWELRRIIISPTGTIVTADTLIASYVKASYTVINPFVIRLADDSYLLVYSMKTVSGATYAIMKRTSADFLSWSAESALSISGLDNTHPIYSPSLCQITTGDIWLWFEYVDTTGPNGEELINIYYSISVDNGSTWAAAVKRTNYTTYGEIGKHPIAIQKIANQMYMIFYRQMGALQINTDTTGWCVDTAIVTNLSFDSVNRKLYAVSGWGVGNDPCIIKLDLDTWSIDKCWSTASTPPLLAVYDTYNYVGKHRWHGDGYLIPIGLCQNEIQTVISVLNGETDTITDYIFRDDAPRGLTKNVNITLGSQDVISHASVNFSEKRLYILFRGPTGGDNLICGWIDLEEAGPTYTFTEIFSNANLLQMAGIRPPSSGQFLALPDDGYIIVSAGYESNVGTSYPGRLRIYDIANGGLIKDYAKTGEAEDLNVGFPYHGLRTCIFSNGKIYGGFFYDDTISGEEDKRGLCCIDLSTDTVIYIRPPWASVNDYRMERGMYVTADGRIIILCNTHGVTIYDPSDNSWELFNNDNVPGLTQSGTDQWYGDIAYDELNGFIFATNWDPDEAFSMFSEYGFLRQAMYQIGTYTTDWAWGSINPMVQGYLDYELVVALDPDDNMLYAFWTRQEATEYSLIWDKESSELKVSDYIVRGTEVAMKESIDSPGSLTFEVSHGHLFDPHNSNSLWSIYLEKFRRLNVKWGEKISGVDYWQQAGVRYVTSQGVGHERPIYPVMTVEAEDRRSMWEFANVDVSDNYDGNTPKEIIEDILAEQADLAAGEMDIPTFDDSIDLWIQWIDTSLLDILKQLCQRFQYFFRIDVDGKASARKISKDNAIDHTYSNLNTVIRFDPDDRFSDWTNQVVIEGEARDFIEVLFAEERIKEMNGTVGWFGGHKMIIAYYSEDKSRRCRNPRLEVIQSVADFQCFINIFDSGGEEYVYDVDDDDKYVIIMIDRPDRTSDLITGIAVLVATMIGCILCDLEYMCGICFSIVALELSYVLDIISGHALYHYAIWAMPIGKERQTYSATADDLTLQTKINKVVQRKFKDALCCTPYDCQFVADYELMIAQLQRGQIAIRKMAHLQDEVGDTIVIPHPISGQNMVIFITEITRRFKIPEQVGGDGYFLDDIVGWKIA